MTVNDFKNFKGFDSKKPEFEYDVSKFRNFKGFRRYDCEWGNGPGFIKHQHTTEELVGEHFNILVIPIGKKGSEYDADIYSTEDSENIISKCEIKCRRYFNTYKRSLLTFDLLKKEDYLITAKKLFDLQKHSEALNIPTFVFANLLTEQKIVYFKVTDNVGKFICKFDVRKTWTRATSNPEAGDAERDNAYIEYDESYCGHFNY